MPDSLEYVVRPYVTPGPHGGIIIPSTPRGSRERATISWGAESTMPEVSGMNFNVVCCKDDLKEKDRKSDTKRIFQNNDENSNNWVDVQRPYILHLDKKEHNSCGDVWDQIDTVGQAINGELAQFEGFFNAVTGNSQDKNCGTTWNFSRDK